MPEIQTPVAVALLYQTNQLGGHLRDALRELGAALVYEALTADIDRDKLEGSGAHVVIVNLDDDADPQIDHVYDVLDEGDYQVVFNEAQVSANLSGWDHARWARNLAAKVLKQPAIAEPPRPVGAQAVPTPVQNSAAGVPVAEIPGAAVVAVSLAVELPGPTTVHATAPVTDDLDIGELAEFAQLAEPDVGATDHADAAPTLAPIEIAPVHAGDPIDDFAAQLDALFADAKPSSEPAQVTTPDTAFTLPADFDLAPESPPVAESHGADFDVIGIPTDVTATQAPAAAPTPGNLHDEFPAIFDQLDHDQLDHNQTDFAAVLGQTEASPEPHNPLDQAQLDQAAAAIPEATDGTFKPGVRATTQSRQDDDTDALLPLEWTLEHSDDAHAAAPALEKISAAEFLAPQVEESSAPAVAAPALDGLSLELMPMEEAIAPTYHNPNYSKEAWLDESRPAQKLKVGTGAGVQRVFVLGASIGGPEAVRDFLAALPARFPVLFVLAQHMGEEFLELMSAQLAKSVTLTVRNPTHGERVSHGEILIVPTTMRLQVDPEGVVTLARLTEKQPYSPSIDQVLHDIADAFGAKAGAIVFSGMAHDAVEGCQYLKAKGGTIWVQDPDTCVISSMVDGAREAGVVDFVGSPKQLAEKMIADYGKG